MKIFLFIYSIFIIINSLFLKTLFINHRLQNKLLSLSCKPPPELVLTVFCIVVFFLFLGLLNKLARMLLLKVKYIYYLSVWKPDTQNQLPWADVKGKTTELCFICKLSGTHCLPGSLSHSVAGGCITPVSATVTTLPFPLLCAGCISLCLTLRRCM